MKRRQWREASLTGKQQPPGPDEHHGDLTMTMACKDVLDPAHMAEVLFEQMASCSSTERVGDGVAELSCDPTLAAARAVCRTPDSLACSYAEDAKVADTGKGAEL